MILAWVSLFKYGNLYGLESDEYFNDIMIWFVFKTAYVKYFLIEFNELEHQMWCQQKLGWNIYIFLISELIHLFVLHSFSFILSN